MHELEEASLGVSLRTTNGKVIALGPTLASLELAGRKFARLFGGPKRAPSPTPGRFADDEIPIEPAELARAMERFATGRPS